MKAEWTNSDSLTTSQTTKAILVIDNMPVQCDKCEVRCDGYTAKEYAEKSIKRPSWCPLKPIPEKRNCGKKTSEAGKIFEAWCWGWDACIDEITGETE